MNDCERAEISRYKPYKNNARTHSAEQLEMIKNSLREFGFVNPIVVDEEFTVLAGHGRLEAAKALGMKDAPYVMVENLTEEQKKAYVLADNKTYDLGRWDYDILHMQAEELDIDMTQFGYEPLDTSAIDTDSEDDNEINDSKELDLDDYSDETFKHKCPNCGFGFNEGK